jgi:hypothetical protein
MSPTTINENGDRTIETNNWFQYRNLKDETVLCLVIPKHP